MDYDDYDDVLKGHLQEELEDIALLDRVEVSRLIHKIMILLGCSSNAKTLVIFARPS